MDLLRISTTRIGALAALLISAACAVGLAQNPTTLAASAPPSPISLGGTAVTVELPAVAVSGPHVPLARRLKDVVAARRVYLTLTGITATDPPAEVYNIYLNLPAGASPRGASDPHYVGTFGFHDIGPDSPQDVAVNITTPLERLLTREAIGDRLWVTLVPAGPVNTAATAHIRTVVVAAR
jgi:hypothetical protein